MSASPRRRSFGLGSQRNTPKSSSGHLPLPPVHSSQPPRTHGRRQSAGSERLPHDSAVALPEEPSHRTVHKPPPDGSARNKGKEREIPLAVSVTPRHDPSPSFDFPSKSLPADPSPLSRDHLSRHPTHLPTVDSASSEENEHTSHRLRAIPKIIHTPPTPQRPGVVDSPSRPSDTPPRVDAAKIEIPKSKAIAIPHREQVLVSSSQSHQGLQRTPSSKGRFRPRFLTGKDVPKSKDSNAQHSSRRAPGGCSDGPTHKTSGSNIAGPVRNMTSHGAKLGSFDFERPISALNRSNSTLDRQKTHVPTDNSKTRLHTPDRTISDDSAPGGKSRPTAHHPEPPMLSQVKPDHTGGTSVISFSSVSLQTSTLGSNAPEGHSSSWGRASGRRMLRTSHGTFAFEPSSLPSTPNPHTFNLPSEQNNLTGHTNGLSQSQPVTPLHAGLDARGKHSRGQSYTTSNKPSGSAPESKSRGKGRSLDLGLGLSWAPSRLREEVLMPGLILTRERARLEKIKANGSDVTKMFESLLSESQFQTFKKCRDFVHSWV